ncbi:hypothetical protein DL766_006669 [Monosporascus sp. MC13-8B]|uniref:NodB homology domain-containing protein n=1 Tax=Monosporascus cannonballus TaxID=155416 RepID=A0ABY0H127_9PEZI|nr:hypothetical protein DL763_010517 [Monosporascus cannonballus]RYO81492.1 hypothetical protein DL762_007069 [Monosporascus cannonballus]RYP26589.1 hypothetical protein DL766_006669 [Monosporascus sp. MC13-8B]
MGKKRVLVSYGIDVDAVSGWLGSYGGQDSTSDISRGLFAGTVGARRLLKLFEKYNMKTTWFIPGHSLETFPEEMAAVRDAGHEIGLHGYSHENPKDMSIEQQRDVLDKTYKMLTEFVGKPPRGSVAPWWECSKEGGQLLLDYGIEYDHSMSHHDCQPYYLRTGDKWACIDYKKKAEEWMKPLVKGQETGLVEIPASWYLDDLPPMMFIKSSPNSHGFVNPRDVEDIWRDQFDYCYREYDEFIFPITIHPDVSGHPQVLLMHERLIEYFKKHEGVDDAFEVLKKQEGQVDEEMVDWIHASVIFLKVIFATGVLTIPSAMYVPRAFPGAVNVLGWQFLNTYCAIVQGNFGHSMDDMANVVDGAWLREMIGLVFLATYVIVGASGIFGSSTALNALSNPVLCMNYFTVVAAVAVFILAGARKFKKIVWLTWVEFLSLCIAIFIVVETVRQRRRKPAIRNSDTTSLETSHSLSLSLPFPDILPWSWYIGFPPVISEMKKPRDYNKAVYLCRGIVTASSLAFSLVVYAYCGKWFASPSLSSVRDTINKVAYSIGLIGLLVSACPCINVAAKYIFVRILRTRNTNRVTTSSTGLSGWAAR